MTVVVLRKSNMIVTILHNTMRILLNEYIYTHVLISGYICFVFLLYCRATLRNNYISKAMFQEIFGDYLLSVMNKYDQEVELNDLSLTCRHSNILGTTTRALELGDANVRVNLPFFVTEGIHPLILGSRFQMAATCYQVHDALGYTCFHSQAVTTYCEHGLPIW